MSIDADHRVYRSAEPRYKIQWFNLSGVCSFDTDERKGAWVLLDARRSSFVVGALNELGWRSVRLGRSVYFRLSDMPSGICRDAEIFY